MTQQDARFEDGDEKPIYLRAEDSEDLAVLATLAQDAVVPSSEIQWDASQKRFGLLLNRFRWERKSNPPERVQSVLLCEGVSHVASDGVDPKDKDQILSILTMEWRETDAPAGQLHITLAGDGGFLVSMECLDLTLKDVTRPYVAPSKKAPNHSLD